MDSSPRQLRECLPQRLDTALLSAEAVLLAVRRVPDPVDEKVGSIQRDQGGLGPCVG